MGKKHVPNHQPAIIYCTPPRTHHMECTSKCAKEVTVKPSKNGKSTSNADLINRCYTSHVNHSYGHLPVVTGYKWDYIYILEMEL